MTPLAAMATIVSPLLILAACSSQTDMPDSPPPLTVQLADSVMDQGAAASFRAILEYKDDGYLVEGYFAHPIGAIKFPGYRLHGFSKNAAAMEEYRRLQRDKTAGESVMVDVTGKIRNNLTATWQIDPETHPFGIIYDFSVARLYLGPTPDWEPYRVEEQK